MNPRTMRCGRFDAVLFLTAAGDDELERRDSLVDPVCRLKQKIQSFFTVERAQVKANRAAAQLQLLLRRRWQSRLLTLSHSSIISLVSAAFWTTVTDSRGKPAVATSSAVISV